MQTLCMQRQMWSACAGEEDLLSRVVNAAISSPLYPLMKVMAKRTMKRTAEGRGVPWGQNIEQLKGRLQVTPLTRDSAGAAALGHGPPLMISVLSAGPDKA